MKAASE